MGIDPIAEHRRQLQRATTLRACFEDFRKALCHLIQKTLYDYDRVLRVAIGDWVSRSISAIKPDMVMRRFQRITDERGEAYANLTMRALRAILNFAMASYDDGTGVPILVSNPVAVLTRTRP